jgi:hypothetical protein
MPVHIIEGDPRLHARLHDHSNALDSTTIKPSRLILQGSETHKITIVTDANITLDDTHDIILMRPTTADRIVTMPDLVTPPAVESGRRYTVKNWGSAGRIVTLNAASGDGFEDISVTTLVLDEGASVTLVADPDSNGVWRVVAGVSLNSSTTSLPVSIASDSGNFGMGLQPPAKAFHTHPREGFTAVGNIADVLGTASAGVRTDAPRGDHRHAHPATQHKSGGAMAIKLDELAAPTDITTLDATVAAHGLMQKYPGGTTTFLRADGTFAAPPAGAGAFTKGQATVNFGSFPGTGEATVDVTGQAGYVSTSFLTAIMNGSTADHSRDEHEAEEAKVTAKYKADGQFTISVRPDPVEQQGSMINDPTGPKQKNALYGQYQITWGWAN